MFPCFAASVPAAASNFSRCMDRPVAIGGFSGTASTLDLSLLRSLAQDHRPVIEVPSVPIELPPLECPNISYEDIPFWTFLAGLGTGLLIGPAIDFIWLLRQKWRRFIWRVSVQEQQGSGRLFKIIA